jgi:hypothetical protein
MSKQSLRQLVLAVVVAWGAPEQLPIAIAGGDETATPRSAQPDLSQMRDITGIEEVPAPSATGAGHIWVWPAVLIVVATFGWGLCHRRRKRAPEAPAPVPWALAELESLQKLSLPETGEVAAYHTLLSHIVRRYLELRFHLPASRRTTVEFFQRLPDAKLLDHSQQVLLREFLDQCDLAKFAGAAFSVEECRSAARMARSFVEQTTEPASHL